MDGHISEMPHSVAFSASVVKRGYFVEVEVVHCVVVVDVVRRHAARCRV